MSFFLSLTDRSLLTVQSFTACSIGGCSVVGRSLLERKVAHTLRGGGVQREVGWGWLGR